MRAALLKRFGANVRRLRRESSLTQEALAERSGHHPNYIGGLERGERNPTLTTLVSLAKGLNVEVEALLPSSRPERGR